MLKVDKIRKKQASLFYIIDYLWGGFATLGVVFSFVALWQFGSLTLGHFLLPSPLTVFNKCLEMLANIKANEIDITLWRSFVGISISLLVGISTGFIAGYFKTAMVVLKPLATILLSAPPIIWIVMALFWFGFGDASVFFTIIVIVTPFTFASSAVAIASINQQHQELFNAYQLGFRKKLRYLYIPHLTSYVLASISVAVATGIRIVVMAELLGASDGIGAKIADARIMLDTTTVLAFVILIILLVALFEFFLIKPLEILFMPWRR